MHRSHFEHGVGDWTNVSGTTDAQPAGQPAGPQYHRFAQLLSTGAGANDGVMKLTTPPTQNATRRYRWQQYERTGDPTKNYGFFLLVFANGADFRNAGFTGYKITQTSTQLILDKYVAGALTNITTQALTAEYGRPYWYDFYYNPATGAYVLRRADVFPGAWDHTYSGTIGSQISSGTFLAVGALRNANESRHTFDDFWVFAGDEPYFRAATYKRPINGAGEWEGIVANHNGDFFTDFEVGDQVEISTIRDDGVEIPDFVGWVDKVSDESYHGRAVRLTGGDALSELARRNTTSSYTTLDIGAIITGIIAECSDYLPKNSVKTAGVTSSRNVKGRSGLAAVVMLCEEANYIFRLDRRIYPIADDNPLIGSEALTFRKLILSRANLQVYHPMNEEGVPGGYTRAIDLSTNNNHGTWNSAPTTGEIGPVDNSYLFAAGAAKFTSGYTQGSISDLTLEAWVKTTSTNTTMIIISSRDTSTSGPFTLSIGGSYPGGPGSAGSVAFGLDKNLVYAGRYTGGSLVNDGKWHHIAGVWDGTSGNTVSNADMKIYIDGVEVSSTATGIGSAPAAPVTGDAFQFGKNSNWTGYTGNMAEGAIYTRALTATELLENYRAGRYGVVIDQKDGRIHFPKVVKDGRLIANRVVVYGAAGVSGSATDSTSQGLYGKRDVIVHDARIGSGTDAGNLATYLKNALKDLVKTVEFDATDYHELGVGERCLLTMKYGSITAQEYLVVEKSFDPAKGFHFRLVPIASIYAAPRSEAELIGRAVRDNDRRNWAVVD